MGKFASDFKRVYWMGRVLSGMVPDPPKDKKFSECTPEEQASRYVNRAYTILTGETFDRKEFLDMMSPPETNQSTK